MKKVLILILTLFTHFFAWSNIPLEAVNLWNEANNAYQKEQYQHAIDNYENLIVQKITDATIYYNLGNAYYKENEIGKAILNYSRALQLKPDFTKAKQNISFIENSRGISDNNLATFSNPNAWNKFLDLLSPNSWAWLAAICILLASTILYFYQKKVKAISIPLSSIGILCLLFSIAAKQEYNFNQSAVIINDKAFLYTDVAKSKVSLNLPEGTSIKLINNTSKEKSTELVKIKLSNDFEGWVDLADIEKI